MPETKEDDAAVEKTYKISFGVMVGRDDIEKPMYIDGLQYVKQSYTNLVIIEATGMPILDEVLPKLRAALLPLGFAEAEATGTEAEKAKLRSLMKTK